MRILLFIILNLTFMWGVFAKDVKIRFSDSTIPYITAYKNKSVKNSFNNELTKILNTLKCNHKQRKSKKAFWDNYTRVSFTKYDILSVRIRSSYNCDGTHPFNDEDHSLSYDLENNRVLTLYDIFLKKDKTFKLIRNSFYESITDKKCREKVSFYLESEKLFKEYLGFYFDKKGIVFKLKLPYGLRFCTKDLEISYSDIINKSALSLIHI